MKNKPDNDNDMAIFYARQKLWMAADEAQQVCGKEIMVGTLKDIIDNIESIEKLK